jgi:RimJ/RimL family protein N-acetyltransferase
MIKGLNVKLRSFKLSDYSETYKIRSDIKGLTQLLAYLGPVSIESEKKWVENIILEKNSDCIYFIIESLKNNEFIGYLSLKKINHVHRTAEFGIYVLEIFRGRGYAKEAINLVLEYCKSILNLRKIKLSVLENNIGAVKLYESLGFMNEGILKRDVLIDGTYTNIKLMSIFTDE